jgi:hypothetical protein
MLITRSTQKVILFISTQEPLVQSAAGHYHDCYASVPCAKVCNVWSYKNAQWFRQTGQCPSRCKISWALFGHILSRVTIVPFCNGNITLHFRERKRVRVKSLPAPGEVLTFKDSCRPIFAIQSQGPYQRSQIQQKHNTCNGDSCSYSEPPVTELFCSTQTLSRRFFRYQASVRCLAGQCCCISHNAPVSLGGRNETQRKVKETRIEMSIQADSRCHIAYDRGAYACRDESLGQHSRVGIWCS